MVKAVVDTGAEVTVLSDKVLDKLTANNHIPLLPVTRQLIVAESGKGMKSSGLAKVKMKIGDIDFPWTVYVAPIGDD